MGDNSRGQLGVGAEVPACSEPQLLTTLPANCAKPTAVACGGAHSLVLLEDGGVLGFGDDRNLQLGVRQRTVKDMRDGKPTVPTPTRLKCFPPDSKVAGIAAGGGGVEGGHSVFLLRREDGDEIWACGYGRFGQLGLHAYSHQSEPKALTSFTKLKEWDESRQKVVGIRVQAVACGERHSAALLSTGNAFVWGWNDHGQLGTGGKQGNHTPALVNSPPELRFTILHGIACGPNSTAAWT